MRAVLDIAFPAKSPRRFNRDTRRGSEDILAPRLALLLEELPAGHRNDGGVDLMVVPQRIGSLHGDGDFRAGSQQGDVAIRACITNHIAAMLNQVNVRLFLANAGR